MHAVPARLRRADRALHLIAVAMLCPAPGCRRGIRRGARTCGTPYRVVSGPVACCAQLAAPVACPHPPARPQQSAWCSGLHRPVPCGARACGIPCSVSRLHPPTCPRCSVRCSDRRCPGLCRPRSVSAPVVPASARRRGPRHFAMPWLAVLSAGCPAHQSVGTPCINASEPPVSARRYPGWRRCSLPAALHTSASVPPVLARRLRGRR